MPTSTPASYDPSQTLRLHVRGLHIGAQAQSAHLPVEAKRILVEAIRTDKEWLVPQAESVLRQLRAQGGGA